MGFKLFQMLAVSAGAFVLIAAAVSFIKFESLVAASRQRRSGRLTNREAFLIGIARRLAVRGARAGAPFCVLVAGPVPGAGAPAGGAVSGEACSGALRRSDDVGPLENGCVGMILPVAHAVLAPILERVADRLGPDHPVAWGVSRFPESGGSGRVLLEKAERAQQAAAAQGAGGRVSDPAPDGEEDEAPVRAIQGDAALLDPLTGILRPERMGGAVRKYIARHRKEGHPVSLLYLDVMQLEEVNQRNGRGVGDALLRVVAQTMHLALREDDLIGRLGDDDFMAVLGCAPEGAEAAAARLVGRLRAAVVPAGMARLHPVVRIGLAGHPGHAGTPAGLMEAAEAAYLEARRRGPYDVVVFEPAMVQRARAERETRDVF